MNSNLYDSYIKELFNREYNKDDYSADQTNYINQMIEYFLDEDIVNIYYTVNINSHIFYYTYNIVKFLDPKDVTLKLGYKYTICVLKTMYKTYEKNSIKSGDEFISIFKELLNIEINKKDKI